MIQFCVPLVQYLCVEELIVINCVYSLELKPVFRVKCKDGGVLLLSCADVDCSQFLQKIALTTCFSDRTKSINAGKTEVTDQIVIRSSQKVLEECTILRVKQNMQLFRATKQMFQMQYSAPKYYFNYFYQQFLNVNKWNTQW